MGAGFDYIQNVDLLSDWCDSQRSQNIVAIDTEFERRNTYFPELCLIQLATSTGIACVDPLLCDDLRPLVHFLNHPERTKVMHAARQDLEVLELFNVKVGGSLIDTQIAAVIVGEADQIGYGELTKKITSVELNKNQQLADWKRRPLSSQQQQYAVDDVRYLLPIYLFLLKRIEKLGRANWLKEDCSNLAKNAESRPTTMAWQRLKNISNLTREVALKACVIANWRELTARNINLPRNWILKDGEIKKIALANPTKVSELNDLFDGKQKFIQTYGEEILVELRNNNGLQDISITKNQKISDSQKKKAKVLTQKCEDIAATLDVSSSYLMTSKDVKGIVKGLRPAKLFEGWRFSVFEETFYELELL